MYPIVRLKPGREKSLLRRHPWVFSGAAAGVEGEAAPGGLVFVESSDGAPLGTGTFNPASDIRVRMLDFKEREIGRAFFEEHVRRTFELRQTLFADTTDAWRLINSEGDGLAGLVVDRYAGGLVVSVETLGMEALRPLWLEALKSVVKPKFIYERSDKDGREAGSGPRTVSRPLEGTPGSPLEIREGDCRYRVDVAAGQKTGFYLDQREGRGWVQCHAAGQKVLNLFAYTGGFTVPALKTGAASVTSVESSRPALELLEENLALNGLDLSKSDAVEGNVFDFLRQCPERSYGLVVVDPPSLCRRAADAVKAARAYKDVNRLALTAAADGAFVLTYSCSHFFTTDLLAKVVYQSALEAGRDVRILKRFSHQPDHPVSVYHPEGAYFKGLLLHVEGTPYSGQAL